MTNPAFEKLNKRTTPSVRRICLSAAATALFTASLAMSFTTFAATVYNVGVAGQNTESEIHTFRKDPLRILSDAGLSLRKDDLFRVTSLNGGNNSRLTVYRNGIASVDVDGKEYSVETTGSVADTIADAGIHLDSGDKINVELGSIAYDGMQIDIDRAYDVFVEDGDKVYTFRTTGCKVGEAIHGVGLSIEDGDELSVPANSFLKKGDTVHIYRCTFKDRFATESIDYGTTVLKDSSLIEGQTKTITKGKKGEALILYRDKYLDNGCVDSTFISSTTVVKPVNEVKAVGTKPLRLRGKKAISNLPAPKGAELGKNGTPKHYKSYMDGVATAYYGGGITASGRPAGVGYVAVDPKVIPYGTKLWVTSLDGEYVYGYAIAADTGGFVKGGWADMDLYMNTEQECWQFGIRDVRIYIL